MTSLSIRMSMVASVAAAGVVGSIQARFASAATSDGGTDLRPMVMLPGFASSSLFRSPEEGRRFEPLVAAVDVQLEVLDQRPSGETLFRRFPGEPRVAYGDEQFFPTRMRVVATHFADAFPNDAKGTRLVIKQLEIVDHAPRPFGDPNIRNCRTPDIGAVICAAVMLVAGVVTSPYENSVACYLSGSYAGIAFSARTNVVYNVPGSRDNEAAVKSALLTAITEATKEIREERSYRPRMAARGTLASTPSPALPPSAPLPFVLRRVPRDLASMVPEPISKAAADTQVSHKSLSLPPVGQSKPAAPGSMRAVLYPSNDMATETGMLSGTMTDAMTGNGFFELNYRGEILSGDATRVPGDDRRRIASAHGQRGTHVSCDYHMASPNRGIGMCSLSTGAQYEVRIGG